MHTTDNILKSQN